MVLHNQSMISSFLLLTVCIFFNSISSKDIEDGLKVREQFISIIFNKYGKANSENVTVIKTERLRDLMDSLSLGKVNVICQLNDTECLRNKYAGHDVARKDPFLSRKRRDSSDEEMSREETIEHQRDWKRHLEKCMTAKNITTLYNIKTPVITKSEFLDICPSLIQQIDEEVCIHYHKRYPELEHPEGPPTPSETWGYGFVAITGCSLLSLAVIAMIPCLKKSFYNVLMAYLVALAVGTLAGDALLHLIPHAFIEGANLAAEIVISKEQRERQHLAQVWRAMFVLAGIYLFYIVEQIMKFKNLCCSSHGNHGNAPCDPIPLDDPLDDSIHMNDIDKSNTELDNHEGHSHGHSHGTDKTITGETKISSVAWMVIVGDGFHNFSDGLAVGAAFSASISSGVSTTIAIFCHELPHELGDFAILLKAGMTIRQAVVYNLVSALLAYVGLAIGILAGEGELGRHVILCVTAGLFLYISLVDMMGELSEHTSITSRFCTIICQHLGLLSGITIMLIISLYEHDM